ncbi:hypothetical protein [Oceanidesulfovibrio marinus]|uniref:Sulfotransferase domain-containing protein n=1 Tax=Oceanidesulfovibrio marinus TaxID=370038 RepID=A0ABX6NK93_9BACT|nr:hypothetical protein [Oceanidesulfovibrio marinus]QJT10626.1 hypothetical protein E8L03_17645 [Oceanidesulfovibrio marinus]
MNVLVLGKSKTGTTVISRTICNSFAEDVQFIFEPTDTQPFDEAQTTPHSVTKVIFDHWLDRKSALASIANNGHRLQFDRRVLIRRDPRDEIISVLLYYPFDLKRVVQDPSLFDTWIDFLGEKERNPAAISFLRMCEMFDSLFHANFTRSLSKFSSFDLGYLHFCQRLKAHHLLLKYEDFIAGNTKALAAYLNLELSDNRDVGAPYKRTYRTGAFDNWKRYFTPEDVAFFRRYEKEFGMLGYDDWTLTPVDRIPAQELSGYVRMLLER